MTAALRDRLFPRAAVAPVTEVAPVDEYGRPADFAARNLAARWVG